MFVPIINAEISAIQIDTYIKQHRNQYKAISPEFALNVLSKTNHIGNIKSIIKYIQNLPNEEQLKYKDFVISAIDGRKQSPYNLSALEQLAIDGGYKKEFDKANEKEKLYEATDSCGTYVTTPDELVDAINQRAPNIIARIDCKDKIVRIDDIELDKVKELKIYNVRDLRLHEKRLPEFLDLSQCDAMIDLECKDFSKVKKISLPKRCDLSAITVFPEIVDASQCEGLRAIKSNVRKLDFFKMKNLDKIILKESYDFQESLDFSNCSEVRIEFCNLTDVKEIKLSEKARSISLRGSENIPENIDISMCDTVILSDCDLRNIKNLKFKNGSKVYLEAIGKKTLLPSDLDVSMCDYVNFEFCDMSGLTNLRFKDGARVILGEILPTNIDISNCSSIETHVSHLDLIEKTKFRNCKKIKLKGYFPEMDILDLSAFSSVDLESCQPKLIKKIKFQKGSDVNMKHTDISGSEIDFSQCAKVNLNYVDLHSKPLNFAEDSEVYLCCCYNFPEQLDLSMCKKADLTGANLHQVKEIKFKNKSQKDEFFHACNYFNGKIVYTEEPQIQQVSSNKDFEL